MILFCLDKIMCKFLMKWWKISCTFLVYIYSTECGGGEVNFFGLWFIVSNMTLYLNARIVYASTIRTNALQSKQDYVSYLLHTQPRSEYTSHFQRKTTAYFRKIFNRTHILHFHLRFARDLKSQFTSASHRVSVRLYILLSKYGKWCDFLIFHFIEKKKRKIFWIFISFRMHLFNECNSSQWRWVKIQKNRVPLRCNWNGKIFGRIWFGLTEKCVLNIENGKVIHWL